MPTAFTREQQENIREQLFQAGISLSKTMGMQGMTVSKLAVAAGIAKGSFYNFFESKETFILELTRYSGEKIQQFFLYLSDMREDVDVGTVVNLIKGMYAMRESRDTMIEGSLENSIEVMLRMLEIYISGKGDLV